MSFTKPIAIIWTTIFPSLWLSRLQETNESEMKKTCSYRRWRPLGCQNTLSELKVLDNLNQDLRRWKNQAR
jgi:hypothetical protein